MQRGCDNVDIYDIAHRLTPVHIIQQKADIVNTSVWGSIREVPALKDNVKPEINIVEKRLAKWRRNIQNKAPPFI